MSTIQPRTIQQTDLFHAQAVAPRIVDTMDKINRKFGKSTVKPAWKIGGARQMKQKFLSPNYSKQWPEIPMVKC
ncbi:MAG: DNA polymerase V [Cellvibrionaceae bacterium]